MIPPRIFKRKSRGKKSARLLVKCGDCRNQLEIYYGDEDAILKDENDPIEIGGVIATRKVWRTILKTVGL